VKEYQKQFPKGVVSAHVLQNTARPWSASGPGWANSGVSMRVRFLLRGGHAEEREITIYNHDLLCSNDMLAIAITACNAVEASCQKLLDRKEKTKPCPI